MKITEIRNPELLSKQDLRLICLWSDLSFGHNYLSPSYLLSYAERGHFLLLHDDEQTLLGAALLIEQSFEETPSELQTALTSKPIRVLYRKFVLIDPNFRKKGLSQLLHTYINQVSESYELCYTSIWLREGVFSYTKHLEASAYLRGPAIAFYWKNDSLARNYTCASCSEIPCACSAVLYYKLNS